MVNDRPTEGQPVIFGEVLFDTFADGSRVLGGAPFNVAWHLRGFGLAPQVITAVGTDETGREALEQMRAWGMQTDGVQFDPVHPTGRVTAKLVDGEPTFSIGNEQAYDYIDGPAAASALGAAPVPLLYHGTLALRGERSFSALKRVRDERRTPTFVDLNLRAPWWTLDRLRWCLDTATWLKLSQEELETVSGERVADVDACARQASRIASQYGLDTVLVTRGSEGSLSVRDGRVDVCGSDPLRPDELVDTVGAGDAFSAVACFGLLAEWSTEEILLRGGSFAADLCRVRGATSEDRSLYDRHRREWEGKR